MAGLAKDNNREAARLYKLAADQGNEYAQAALKRVGVEEIGARSAPAAAQTIPYLSVPSIFDTSALFEASAAGDLSRVQALLAAKADVNAKRPAESSVPADEPMRFVVVRSSQAGCEPKCAEWISAEGAIVLSTAEQFAKKFVRSLGGRKLPNPC